MNVKIFLFLILLGISIVYSSEKYEFRGVWIATVKNIDWPSSPGLSVEAQKQELVKILNVLDELGINAVFFQVRTECDAFYESEIEPWSFWLTGSQGKPPDSLFDPLNFIINEAHKRGMELHAWFNPLRVGIANSTYLSDSTHISFRKPEWILQSDKYKFLNPGIKEVRDYTTNVIVDVVHRYEIDGVHFDDYFYPYTGISQEDKTTFEMFSRGFDNIEDWRRDNVNLLVEDVYNNIKSAKPHIKFGISPFGIWKDGIPFGVTGISAYHDIYCDATYWLNNKIVDYIVPQLYWQIGGAQDYVTLTDWWSGVANGRHIYTGHALYKMNSNAQSWQADEIINQIKISQNNSKIAGSVLFRTSDIVNNIKGIADSLRNKSFTHKAIIPGMKWIDKTPPLFPHSLTAISCANGIYLQWYNPVPAHDNDGAKYNVIYRFDLDETNIENPRCILDIIPGNKSSFTDTTGIPNRTYKYMVTALDKIQNESKSSNIVQIEYTEIESYPGPPPLTTGLSDTENIITQKYSKIKFNICKKEFVKLTLFDENGNILVTLVEEELLPGKYSAKFKYFGNSIKKYHCKLSTPTFSDMKSFRVFE